MRSLLTMMLALLLAGCSTGPGPGPGAGTTNESRMAGPAAVAAAGPVHEPPDSIVQFLLTSAATDFRTHGGRVPLGFRNVRIGHLPASGGEGMYFMCGEFLSAKEGEEQEWAQFETIKTSGYEQWLGGQRSVFCGNPSVVWHRKGDFSSSLQSLFDSLGQGGRGSR